MEVREYFQLIAQQAKKFTKPEVKKMVDEFEMKINADENQQVVIKQNQLTSGNKNRSKSTKKRG